MILIVLTGKQSASQKQIVFIKQIFRRDSPVNDTISDELAMVFGLSKKTTTEASREGDTLVIIALKKQKEISGPRRAAQDVVILEAPGCEYANLPALNFSAASRGILDRPFPLGRLESRQQEYLNKSDTRQCSADACCPKPTNAQLC